MPAALLSMDSAAAFVAVHVVMRFFIVPVFYLFAVVPMMRVVMPVTQAQLHRVSEVQMQAGGFCFLSCGYTACHACYHYQL
ncbi:MAG: hypothetical protein IJ498_03540 [Akkermansia sp.]|nr:hypothetical protein [Akkermansia sp.]